MTLSDLIRHIPNQRAIASAIGPRTYRSTGEYAGMLSLGVIAGAALTLALAPTARRELRKKAAQRWDALRTRVRNGRRWINGGAEERAASPR